MVLDNASENNEYQTLKEAFANTPKVHVYYSPENLGFAKGSNHLYQLFLDKNIDYDYLAMLNNDAMAHPEWLTEMIRIANSEKAQLISCRMLRADNPEYLDNVGHQFINTSEIVPIGFSQPAKKYRSVISHWGPCAGACLYERNMLDHIGLFDPFFDTGYEDAELGLRATIAGYKSVYAPKAIVTHKISQSVDKIMSTEYIIGIQENILYSYYKLLPTSFKILNAPFMFFKYLMVLLIDIVSFRWTFLKIMIEAWKRTWITNRKTIKEKRKTFYSSVSPVSSLYLFRKATFFLWFDFKRFINLVVKGEKSKFD